MCNLGRETDVKKKGVGVVFVAVSVSVCISGASAKRLITFPKSFIQLVLYSSQKLRGVKYSRR